MQTIPEAIDAIAATGRCADLNIRPLIQRGWAETVPFATDGSLRLTAAGQEVHDR